MPESCRGWRYTLGAHHNGDWICGRNSTGSTMHRGIVYMATNTPFADTKDEQTEPLSYRREERDTVWTLRMDRMRPCRRIRIARLRQANPIHRRIKRHHSHSQTNRSPGWVCFLRRSCRCGMSDSAAEHEFSKDASSSRCCKMSKQVQRSIDECMRNTERKSMEFHNVNMCSHNHRS